MRSIRLSVALSLSAILIISVVAAPTASAKPPAKVLLGGLSSPKALATAGDSLFVGQGFAGSPGPILEYVLRGPDKGETFEMTEPLNVVDVAISPLDGTGWAIGTDWVLYHQLEGGTIVPVLDFEAYQAGDHDPVDQEGDPDETNPYGLVILPNGDALVADAAGNDLVRVTPAGDAWTVARFDVEMQSTRNVPGDDPLPPSIPAEAVPTSVAIGPDGDVFVGELKGFPFRRHSSRIWRIDPDSEGAWCSVEGTTGGCERFANGFTAIQDIYFAPNGKTYYVYELAEDGVFAFEAGFDTGDFPPAVLLQITKKKQGELANGQLSEPGGVVVNRGVVYVTDGMFSEGRLLQIPD